MDIKVKELLNYIDILIVALIVVFLFFKFRSLLGKRTGYVKPKDTFPNPSTAGIPNLTQGLKTPQQPLETPLNNFPEGSLAYKMRNLELKEPSFIQNKFLISSHEAFKMIIKALSTNNLTSVRAFINEQVYNSFKSALDNLSAMNKKQYIKIKNFLITDIIDVEEKNDTATVIVKFVTEQQKQEYDIGNSEEINFSKITPKVFTDVWVFSKKINDGTSIWKLVATK